MSSQLGPLEVHCDAPAYSVVRACRQLGFCDPEDVRWCQMSHFLGQGEGLKGLFQFLNWQTLIGRADVGEVACPCGNRLPALERYTFAFSTGREESYLLGQCAACRTVFWEDA